MTYSIEPKAFQSLLNTESQSGDVATEESWVSKREWSEQTSPIEDSRMSSHAVMEDGTSVGLWDVLCGRDRLIHSHPGNNGFRCLINEYREHYQSAKHREEKTSITAEIIYTVNRYGGRFLKQEKGSWREVDPSYAHEKVSHALRSAKDPNRVKPKRTRNVPIRPPSAEEERFFRILLADQQTILQRLLKNRVDGCAL